MTCTVGPVSAIVIDVIHPGVRATGASVLALFQNLFGLAAGPVHRRRAVGRLGTGAGVDRHAAVRRWRRRWPSSRRAQLRGRRQAAREMRRSRSLPRRAAHDAA